MDVASSHVSARGYHKWLVFASALLSMVIDVGFIFSSGALFVDIMSTFNTNRSQAAIVQSVLLSMRYFAGMFCGALVQRFGALKAGVFGSGIATIGLVLSFFSTSVIYLVFSMSVLVATGSSCLFIASSVAVGQYFKGKLGLILMSAQSAGGGLGGMLYPFVLEYLSRSFGLRGTLLIVGGLYMQMIPAALLWTSRGTHAQKREKKDAKQTTNVKIKSKRLKMTQCVNDKHVIENTITEKEDKEIVNETEYQQIALNSDDEAGEDASVLIERTLTAVDDKTETVEHSLAANSSIARKESALECLKALACNPSFVFYALGLGVLYPSLGILFIFIIDLFMDAGLTEEQGSLGLLLVHMCSIFGRLLPGLFMQSRKVATLSVPMVSALITSASMVGLAYIKSLEVGLFLCCLIGIPYGTFSSVYNVTTLRLVGINRLSNAIGVLFTLTAFGSALAGPVSGLLRDAMGTYRIPFLIAAGAIFAGAILFAISLRLRRSHKHYITETTALLSSGNHGNQNVVKATS